MYQSHTPRLIEVDPHRIKFSPANPRKHRGAEYLRLKNSIEKTGMVQIPTVRDLPAGFYECVDGEGRVLVARENHQKTLWVVSIGVLHDQEALTMLQAANAVRGFGLLAQCRCLANLHRQGLTTTALADRFGVDSSVIKDMVAIGYFPDELFTLMLDDLTQSEEDAHPWNCRLLSELLPLRQELPGKQSHHLNQRGVGRIEHAYDYQEVRPAIEKVLRGEITTAVQMRAYVAQRRNELFQARFDQVLQTQLESELAQAKRALEEDYSLQVQQGQQETVQRYDEQMKRLQHQLATLDKRYQAAVREAAKQPEIVEQLQCELQQQVEQTEKERQHLQELQLQVQEEAYATQRQLQEDMRRQLETEREQQRARMDQEYIRVKMDLDAHYARKERELQFHAEKNVHQIVANATKLLAESQLSLLYLTSPGVLPNMVLQQDPEMVSLLAQMRAVRETLDSAEEKLLHGDIVFSSDADQAERRSSNGYQSYH